MKIPVLVLVTTLLFAGTAWAQKSKRTQARNLAQSGVNAYDLGDFQKALGLFERAYEAYPDPDILYSIAQSHRKLGHDQQALETYKAYLRNKPNASDRAEVTEQIDELTKLIESQKRAREKPPEGTRAPIPPEPEPPSPPTLATPPVDTPPRARWYADPVGWSLVGAGVVAAAVGTGLHVSASGRESDLAAAPESERADIRESVKQRRTIGTVVLIGGGALIAGGIVKLALRTASPEGRPIAVSVGPGYVGLAGSF